MVSFSLYELVQILWQNLQVVQKIVASSGGGGHVVVPLARRAAWRPAAASSRITVTAV